MISVIVPQLAQIDSSRYSHRPVAKKTTSPEPVRELADCEDLRAFCMFIDPRSGTLRVTFARGSVFTSLELMDWQGWASKLVVMKRFRKALSLWPCRSCLVLAPWGKEFSATCTNRILFPTPCMYCYPVSAYVLSNHYPRFKTSRYDLHCREPHF